MSGAGEGRLLGQTAVITGAGGIIGRAVAEAFAREGANLCLCDRAAPHHAADALTAHGRDLLVLPVDVTRPDESQAVVAQAASRFGRIDILVNVAGVTSFGSAANLLEAEWDRVIDTNLKGTFFFCQAVVPEMRRRRYGRIINMGSIVGKNGGNARPWLDPAEQDHAANVAYGVSKAGVHTLTAFLARELAADGITVNAIAPGPIASPMTTTFPETLRAMIPIGRLGRADEVAEAALFLAGSSTSFVTAEILDVNGGMWAD